MLAPGELWTVKELFVLPNEYIYWSVQIVMYPFMTGLVAGAFVLSSLYHLFGIQSLRNMARFSLVFSFALLPVALLPLLLHLQQPLRGIEVLFTPHFTSAIAAFGIVFSAYGALVASELWFINRRHFVERALALRQRSPRTAGERAALGLFSLLTLGAWDLSETALHRDERAVKILAGVGIPVACFLHGYAGFIFGSVKANALWMTPLMPVIFIVSAIVSGIALCMLTYVVTMELRKLRACRAHPDAAGCRTALAGVALNELRVTSRYLLFFLLLAISLELLDLIFRGYTAVKTWDILRSVIYGRDFVDIFILQYGIGNLLPLILLVWPGLSVRRAVVSVILILFGVFMMRWNVVIGGQSFSLTFAGYMEYHMPLIPHDWETFREGLGGALLVAVVPFGLFWLISRVLPVFPPEEAG